MSEAILKATEITDAKISFVSLVNKAANKRTFLITKAEQGCAQFQSEGTILMSDSDTHYITGVVYEPNTEDAHGNFMTDTEIAKAEKYFSDKCNQIDIQHSFSPCEGATVVDSWIEKCDCKINDQPVKKGSWLMTIKVEDDELWGKVEKGEITGLSMGGTGKYSSEEVELEKPDEKEGLFVKLAKALGYDIVKKGSVRDSYDERIKDTNFWQAYSSLENVLRHYDSIEQRYIYSDDSELIREALTDFCDIVNEVLGTEDGVQKAVVNKAPKADEKEGTTEKPAEDKTQKKTDKTQNKEEKPMAKITKAEIEQLISEAVADEVKKHVDAPDDTNPKDEDSISLGEISKSELSDIIKSAVSSELEKYDNVRGYAKNLDNEENEIEKADENQHYLHGVL